jgi:L-serine dehydratase
MLSVLDLFRIGIGPSSSHTLGPIRIAKRFLEEHRDEIDRISRIEVELQGSLALTGKGHATPKAVVLGLCGAEPETLDPEQADRMVEEVASTRRLSLLAQREIAFDPERDIVFAYDVMPDLHPNGMKLSAFGNDGDLLAQQTYYSTGGGFIATERQLRTPAPDDLIATGRTVP